MSLFVVCGDEMSCSLYSEPTEKINAEMSCGEDS